MTPHDIYVAMLWISWRLEPYNRKKYSQEYIDKKAITALENILEDPYVSEDIKAQALTVLQTTGIAPGDGKYDAGCNDICKQIFRLAKDEDLRAMLAANPRKIRDWSDLWKKIRNKRTRLI